MMDKGKIIKLDDKKKTVSTIMNLPKTRKQIEANQGFFKRISKKIEYKLNEVWNEFFQPEVKFDLRESNLITALVIEVAAAAMFTFVYLMLTY